MSSQAESGRRLVLAVIVMTLIISVVVIVFTNMVQGPDRLPVQVVRFLLTIGLCVFLYRGANWARWVAGILFILGGLFATIAGLASLLSSPAGLFLIAMGVVYLVSAVILLFVPAVRAHFHVGGVEAV